MPPPSGAQSAKAASYARFIPREELNSFSAWAPGDVSGQAAPAARAETRKTTENPEKQAELIRAARQAGYQDGYRDGLVALDGFKQSFAQQTTRQVGALLQSIGEQLDALQGDMAKALASTAVSLAAQVLRAELARQPTVVVRVAEEAIEMLMLNARHITVRVHPDDHALVADGAADVIAARGARLISDATVTRGGCLVDCDIGSVDASIESRWSRAAATLGLDTAWNASSASASGADSRNGNGNGKHSVSNGNSHEGSDA